MMENVTKQGILFSIKGKTDDLKIEKSFDLFEKILMYDTNKQELDGLRFQWENALKILYDENSSFSDAKQVASIIFNIEPFLKKILFLVDRGEYERIVKENKGLMPLMKILGLNPTKNPYGNNPINNKHWKEIFAAYELRNLTAHQASDYSRNDYYANVEFVIITILCAIVINLEKLLQINYYSACIDVSDYMYEIVNSFREKNKKYINLDGSEDVKSINTVVFEDIDSIDDLDDIVDREPRKGEINSLRKNSVPERKMLIVGEAGLGKTTTIEYLAYTDAQERLRNNGCNIPVLLYLNLLIDPKLTIIDYIAKKISTSIDDIKKLLKHGEINLFLDGLNEIPNTSDLLNARLAEINSLVRLYPKCFIIISTRPQTNNLIHKIPRFNLLSMDNEKQLQFIEKNCKDDEIKKLIITTIDENEKIRRVVRTPLFMNVFVKVVTATHRIPSSEGDLIRTFVNSLFDREISEKSNLMFDKKKASYLLRTFAYEVKEKYKANCGVIESEVIDMFARTMRKYSFSIDTLDYLSIFMDLGLITLKDGLYCFYHEAYQDYFYSEELRFILGLS